MAKSDTKTHLDLMQSLERGDVVSQMTLSRQIGVSVGLINALLKRAIKKGHVKVRSAPYKRYAYYLTPKGFTEKSRLVVDYLDHSLSFFRSARSQYAELFARERRRGSRKFILFGAGELAEIAVLAAWDIDIEVIGIVDDKTNRRQIAGVRVVKFLTEADDYDRIVLTDTQAPQKALDFLCGNGQEAIVLVPEVLGTTAPTDREIGAEAPS